VLGTPLLRLYCSAVLLLLLCLPVAEAAAIEPAVDPTQLAIVVNTADPESRATADYYRRQRGISEANVIEVKFPPGHNVLGVQDFQRVYAQVKAATPANVQFYALAWSRPFRVGCMSVTSAFAFGFDEAWCARGCKATKASPYYNSDSRKPFDDFGIRPAMLLAGSSREQVNAMIDRGVRSDHTFPDATAYLVSTSNRARNVRANTYANTIIALGGRLKLQQVNTDSLTGKDDVLFYFTGMVKVDGIDSNTFVDGAIADHLTSAGGVLFDGRQMSLLRWLDAGATGSYGTVVEPCAFPQKFPQPAIVIERYTRGESLIEAYWQSVAWPGQGVFVGEPLAAPFAATGRTARAQSELSVGR
jgi:uncharacterized protein (TIGR03790 family)